MKRLNGLVCRRATALLLGGVSLAAIGTVSIAQSLTADPPLRMQTDYFGYSASIAGRLAYSDNIRLAPDGFEDEEYIASTVFSGGAITSTNRFTGIVLGDLDLSYLINDEDFNVSQNVGGAGTATIAENLFYFDISGQTSRQLVGDNARFSRSINSARSQQANVHSYAASPYFYRRLRDDASVTLRYRFSQVFIDDSDSVFGAINPNFLNDSRTHEVVAQYDSGNRFDKLRFTLSAYGDDTTESGSDVLPRFGYTHGALEAAAEFALSRKFGISGAVGYDDVETDDAASQFFDDEELSGVFWRAGFTARPNRRTVARVEYGQRFDDEFIDAAIAYQLSPRLNLTASANRSFTSRARSLDVRFRQTRFDTLRFAETLREGQEISPRSLINEANRYSSLLSGVGAQTVGVGAVDSARVILNGDYGRTRFSLGGFYADSDFGFREIEAFSINGDIQREMTRRLTAYGGLNYRRADNDVDQATCEANPTVFGLDAFVPAFDPVAECAAFIAANGVTNTLTATIGADYRFFENVSLFAEYSRSERWSDTPSLDYSENLGFAGVRVDF